MDLPATLMFDYPTISAMAGYMAMRFTPAAVSSITAGDLPLAAAAGAQHGSTHTTELIGISSAMATSGHGKDGIPLAPYHFTAG